MHRERSTVAEETDIGISECIVECRVGSNVEFGMVYVLLSKSISLLVFLTTMSPLLIGPNCLFHHLHLCVWELWVTMCGVCFLCTLRLTIMWDRPHLVYFKVLFVSLALMASAHFIIPVLSNLILSAQLGISATLFRRHFSKPGIPTSLKQFSVSKYGIFGRLIIIY